MSYDFKIQNGDLAIDPNTGDLTKVENTDKLIQDILKIALTKKGSNQFYPWYGSSIAGLVGQVFDFNFTASAASEQLRGSLEILQKLQQAQIATGQTVTAAESFAAIKQIGVARSPVDPRIVQVNIAVLTKALTTAYTSFNITL